MASSRKKLDENNLKTLRELAALPQNKFCFDCGQRGPTYVNVTVGSFVCTKCSGLLRGLTPPHRVKSISMATFTTEEIDTIRNKGNDYCKRTWLGLHEGPAPAFADELQVREFMVEKYEKKRFYLENNNVTKQESMSSNNPSWDAWSNNKMLNGTKNGYTKRPVSNNNNNRPQNGTSRSRPEVKNHHHQNGLSGGGGNNNNNLRNGGGSFAVDFDKADIFSINASTSSAPAGSSSSPSQSGFADFEHNQVYNASNGTTNGTPSASAWTAQQQQQQQQQVPLNPQTNGLKSAVAAQLVSSTPPPPVEDKYAALKDLDNEMKQQQHQDLWSNASNTTGSTGSLYSSSTPNTGSIYSSPSPQGSLFGSPSQGQFMNAFSNLQEAAIANPFGNGQQTSWTAAGNGFGAFPTTVAQPAYVNPFKDSAGKMNGFSTNGFSTNGFQPATAFANGSSGLNGLWGGNPFKVTAVNGSANPNNPFL